MKISITICKTSNILFLNIHIFLKQIKYMLTQNKWQILKILLTFVWCTSLITIERNYYSGCRIVAVNYYYFFDKVQLWMFNEKKSKRIHLVDITNHRDHFNAKGKKVKIIHLDHHNHRDHLSRKYISCIKGKIVIEWCTHSRHLFTV